VLVRWLLGNEVALYAACALLTLQPRAAPVGIRDVADAIGISPEDAAKALSELRRRGYARETEREYEPTERGERLLASLAAARREAMATFLAGLTEKERRELAEAL
jgi:DNA-binding MarR family transcriptional regulator